MRPDLERVDDVVPDVGAVREIAIDLVPVAQARAEGVTLETADPRLRTDDVDIAWLGA